VLKAGGAILKLVPGPNHLKELRHLAKDQLRKESYDNRDIVEHFKAMWDRLKRSLSVVPCRFLPIMLKYWQI
jgi:23S rRNA (guanine745-N1)-methyltransferase